MEEKISDLEYEYLEEVLTDLEGIGKATAANVIAGREKFTDFDDLHHIEISDIEYINADKAKEIAETFSQINFDHSIEVLYTQKVLKEFLDKQYKNVKKVHLNDLDINVLLIKALGFTTIEETVEFYIYQRITRSVVTSWGSGALEKMCLISGAEEIPKQDNVDVNGKRFDMRTEKNDNTYYIQLKSGPNTMNVSMVDSLNNMIREIENKHPDAKGLLGMTYGKESQISSQIKNNLNNFNEKSKIGTDFWKFLTEQEDYFSDLIQIITGLSEEYEDRYEYDYLDLVENKKEELIEEWKEEYGEKEGLDDFIDQYTAE
jgi:hypothetical protein